MRFKGILIVLMLLFIGTRAEALTIKMATLAPEGSIWYNLLREMADE